MEREKSKEGLSRSSGSTAGGKALNSLAETGTPLSGPAGARVFQRSQLAWRALNEASGAGAVWFRWDFLRVTVANESYAAFPCAVYSSAVDERAERGGDPRSPRGLLPPAPPVASGVRTKGPSSAQAPSSRSRCRARSVRAAFAARLGLRYSTT